MISSQLFWHAWHLCCLHKSLGFSTGLVWAPKILVSFNREYHNGTFFIISWIEDSMYSFQLRPIQTISRFGFQLPAARFNERKSKQQMVGPPQLNKHTYLAKLFHQPRFPSWNKRSSLPKTTIWVAKLVVWGRDFIWSDWLIISETMPPPKKRPPRLVETS